jgi:hypothetical protein
MYVKNADKNRRMVQFVDSHLLLFFQLSKNRTEAIRGESAGKTAHVDNDVV